MGFHFVSNTTMKNIDKLTKDLIEITLKQNYMGEEIPVNIFFL